MRRRLPSGKGRMIGPGLAALLALLALAACGAFADGDDNAPASQSESAPTPVGEPVVTVGPEGSASNEPASQAVSGDGAREPNDFESLLNDADNADVSLNVHKVQPRDGEFHVRYSVVNNGDEPVRVMSRAILLKEVENGLEPVYRLRAINGNREIDWAPYPERIEEDSDQESIDIPGATSMGGFRARFPELPSETLYLAQEIEGEDPDRPSHAVVKLPEPESPYLPITSEEATHSDPRLRAQEVREAEEGVLLDYVLEAETVEYGLFGLRATLAKRVEGGDQLERIYNLAVSRRPGAEPVGAWAPYPESLPVPGLGFSVSPERSVELTAGIPELPPGDWYIAMKYDKCPGADDCWVIGEIPDEAIAR